MRCAHHESPPHIRQQVQFEGFTWLVELLSGILATKVAGHIPARISYVPSWDAETIFLYILSAPQSWCKSTFKKIKIFQHVCDFLQIFKGNLVE
jgi:hypothetical protein